MNFLYIEPSDLLRISSSICWVDEMFPPHMMGRRQPEPKPLVPEHLHMPLRVAGFVLAVVAIVMYGDQLDMPEAPRV